MEESILKTIKKILGISEDYTVFDFDLIIHINSAFSILHQLGVGPTDGFAIEDDTAEWADFIATNVNQYNLVRTYVFLKVRMLFDPPTTSYLLEAMNKQIEEQEWRISNVREGIVMNELAAAEALAEEEA